jgi:hypothetical protein
MERKVSCRLTNSAHVVWICNGKLVTIGDHPVHQTCMENDQLVLEVLIRIFVVVYSVPFRGSHRSGLPWVVQIFTSLSHTDFFTYFIQLYSVLAVHGCLLNIFAANLHIFKLSSPSTA